MTVERRFVLALEMMRLAGMSQFGRDFVDPQELAKAAQIWALAWGSNPPELVDRVAKWFVVNRERFPSAAEFARKGREFYQEAMPVLVVKEAPAPPRLPTPEKLDRRKRRTDDLYGSKGITLDDAHEVELKRSRLREQAEQLRRAGG